MTRWLLSTFPTWALPLIVVGGLVVLAWAGFELSRRRLPHLIAGEYNDVAGVMLGILVGVYGIVLAFVCKPFDRIDGTFDRRFRHGHSS